MTQERYSGSAILLHWLIAAALAFQFGLGEALEHLPKGPKQLDVIQFHKAIGMTILALTLVRIGVRAATPRVTPVGDSGWAQRLAGAAHLGLYAFMILAPITGWIASSTGRLTVPIDMFGLFHWPAFPGLGGLAEASRHGLHEFGEESHVIMTKIGMVLFLLHIAGALRHQFLAKQRMVERMMGGNRTLSPIVGSAHIIGFAAVMAALLAWGKTGPAPATDPAIAQSVQDQLAKAAPQPAKEEDKEEGEE
ncbi:MAG: cytochrome b [Sphingomonadales bacterium]|nr:cytochrome b [Sphingomonadales bacterium]